MKLFKKIKSLVTHPYAAPVTETAKGIGNFAFYPLAGFIERIREGFDDNTDRYDDDYQKKPKLLRMYKRLFYTDDSAGFISFFGSVIAGVGGGIVAGVTAAGGGAGILGIAGSSALAVGLGAATGPFLLAGVIATVAACTGLFIGGVPGLLKGAKMAIDHRKLVKAQGQVAAALPAKAADPDFTQALGKALSPFNDLTPEQRAAYVKMMNEQHEEAARGQGEKLLQALDSLPEKERDTLLRGLKPRLKDEFEQLAQKDANNSTVLQNEIKIDGPIKLKVKKP